MRPAFGAALHMLGGWLVGLLIASGAFDVLGTIAGLTFGRSVLPLNSPVGQPPVVTASAVAVLGLALIGNLVGVGLVVIWLVWQHTLASSRRVDPSLLRRSPGWHIGSWFIPVGSIWMPYQNMVDLWRAVHAGPTDEWGRGTIANPQQAIAGSPLMRAWWTAWLASRIVPVIGTFVATNGGRATQVTASLVVADIVATLTTVVAVVLAVLVVRRITDAALGRQQA